MYLSVICKVYINLLIKWVFVASSKGGRVATSRQDVTVACGFRDKINFY